MKVKILFFVCLLSIISSCSYYGYDYRDIIFKREYRPSYKINAKDRYCVFYKNWNAKIDGKDFDIVSLNKTFIDTLKEVGIANLKEEELRPNMKDKESEEFQENIINREIKNNYENCDYIIDYDFTTFLSYYKDGTIKKTDTYNTCFGIRATNIKEKEKISNYQVCKDGYKRKNQNEFFKNVVLKWWESQNKSNKKKFEAMECNYIGCKTIKCKGDNCSISEIKEYK